MNNLVILNALKSMNENFPHDMLLNKAIDIDGNPAAGDVAVLIRETYRVLRHLEGLVPLDYELARLMCSIYPLFEALDSADDEKWFATSDADKFKYDKLCFARVPYDPTFEYELAPECTPAAIYYKKLNSTHLIFINAIYHACNLYQNLIVYN